MCVGSCQDLWRVERYKISLELSCEEFRLIDGLTPRLLVFEAKLELVLSMASLADFAIVCPTHHSSRLLIRVSHHSIFSSNVFLRHPLFVDESIKLA